MFFLLFNEVKKNFLYCIYIILVCLKHIDEIWGKSCKQHSIHDMLYNFFPLKVIQSFLRNTFCQVCFHSYSFSLEKNFHCHLFYLYIVIIRYFLILFL